MKTIYSWLIVALATVTSTTNVAAQSTSNSLFLVTAAPVMSFLPLLNEGADNTENKPLSIGAKGGVLSKGQLKASKSFDRRFKDAENVEWYEEKQVLAAYFNSDKIKNTVIFDKKGHWLYTMKLINKEQVTSKASELINRSYPGFSISAIQMFETRQLNFSVYHIEDAKSFKTIIEYLGELQVYEEFNK